VKDSGPKKDIKAIKKIKGDSPLFLYFDYSGVEKSERWKKGTVPFYFLPKGKKCRHLIEIIQQTK
jgi:type II restriction/modification system DNA methylase subunit YeeA